MSMRFPPFDASNDLLDDTVPAGMSPPEAVQRVKAAVQALPVAGWTSVDYTGLVPPGLPWLRVYEPGCCVPRDDGVGGAGPRCRGTGRACAVDLVAPLRISQIGRA